MEWERKNDPRYAGAAASSDDASFQSVPITPTASSASLGSSTSYGAYTDGSGAYGNGTSTASTSYQDGSYGYNNTANYTPSNGTTGEGIRRRTTKQTQSKTPSSYDDDDKYTKLSMQKAVRKLDIMFPKVEQDLTVQTDEGGFMSLVGYMLIFMICLVEIWCWRSGNMQTVEHVVVDKSLGKKMRVDLNITFPAIHCDDLHMDVMDVAGDIHSNVDETLFKRRLHLDGSFLSDEEIKVETNKAYQQEVDQRKALDKSLAPNYCGPCYGAGERGQCCNHCDDVLDLYKQKGWHVEDLKMIAEQCVREGKTKPKRVKGGEGCRMTGYMKFNRLNGNFHLAMGEGVERNGMFIHTFIPNDAVNYNASHIIHELRFGPDYDLNIKKGKKASLDTNNLNGVTKIVKEEHGSTGTFQYFLKIVPQSFKGKELVESITSSTEEYVYADDNQPQLETNKYFTTERFLPLMEDLDEEHWELGDLVVGDDDKNDDHEDDDQSDKEDIAGAKIGGQSGHTHGHHEHHRKQQPVLPGVFFIYQIYPFAIEVTKDRVPFTHLLIRLMATIGGVFTIIGWLDTLFHTQKKNVGTR